MIAATITLWTHALAALLFATLAFSQRNTGASLPRIPFIAALSATAMWALAVAGIDSPHVITWQAECVRDLAWLAFMYALARRDRAEAFKTKVAGLYAVLAVVLAGSIGLSAVSAGQSDAAVRQLLEQTRIVFHLLAAVGALLLLYRLGQGEPWRTRAAVRIAVVSLAALWSVDLVVYGAAWSTGTWPAALIDVRGAVMVVLAPLLGLAIQRRDERKLQVSRTIALLSLALVAIGLYVAVTALATGVVGTIGGSYARLVQTALIFATTAALLTIVSTPWTRAWAKVLVAKHLFSHRYDYRSEWLRFTDTLGTPDDDAASLEVRVVKAVSDLTGSTGGLVLLPGEAALERGPAWNWPDAPGPEKPDDRLFAHLASSGQIIELDSVRTEKATAEDAGSVGPWLRDDPLAWVVVPLQHFDRLAGAIVLTRPLVDRALDWEDFDLLGVAGRQVASYLAEARAHAALADAQRFDEFNRRFAFIMHDLKNLVSQLTLVARNAERHADNPAFRADMVATLTDSANRMNGLLARLSQHHGARGEAARPVALFALSERIASGRRAQHPVIVSGDASVHAIADPSSLETLLTHLVQNAIEASKPGEAVRLLIGADGGKAAITIVDRGCGMSAAFVRDQLFRPFASSKPGGFGLGAFEARQLAEAMGGSVTVSSREGEGTSFRITLPESRGAAIAAEIAA